MLTSIRELILPAAILLVIASLLVPVPPFLLDLCIVLNFLIAVGLVILTLQLTDSLQLSSLPTILLLSTLFRLCLNVSSTRMILTYGSAGTVIESFGEFVLGGSVGVGVIIFIMLTLIQFIVVAKGSERVAEVAARFTLDALPGKQMAIDADVRAGLYDMQVARQKRSDLQTESRFYGALDGAMKFVKGDAIAAICIVVINGIGGVVAGFVSGLSLTDIMHHYSVLTIGDGIASQIPSLLNSLAAGLVVTRVAGGKNTSLSIDLLDQVCSSKMLIRSCAGVAATLGCFPGMPSTALWIAAGLIFSTQMIASKPIQKIEERPVPVFAPKATPLLQLCFPQAYFKDNGFSKMRHAVEALRKSLFEQSGILLAQIPIDSTEDINDECAPPVLLLIRGTIAEKFAVPVDEDFQPLVEQLADFCLQNRVELIDDTLAKRLLDWHEPHMPELVNNIIPHVISLTQLTEVLRALAVEEVSLRTFDVILQSIAETAQRVTAERPLSEEIRGSLKRYICNAVIDSRTRNKKSTTMLPRQIYVAVLDTDIEALPWSDGMISLEIIEHIRCELHGAFVDIDAVLVGRDIRRSVAEWLRAYQIHITVLTHAEIVANVTIQPVLKISTPVDFHAGASTEPTNDAIKTPAFLMAA